jgi:hypothetical protein
MSVEIRRFLCMLLGGLAMCSMASAQWKPHVVRQLNGRSGVVELAAQSQVVTEGWNRVAAVPYIVYMAERDRVLMLVSCDYPHHAMVLWSDDRGATWTEPRDVHADAEGKPDTSLGLCLTYLGQGKVVLCEARRWFSEDYGEAWGNPQAIPPGPEGGPFYQWDAMLVDRDPATGSVVRLAETGYNVSNGWSQAFIRFSADEGLNWSEALTVPQWSTINEVALVRARNGDLVAACRTDFRGKFRTQVDHYEGLAVSVSKDDGHTWSERNRLYDWGRHHPSMVVLPSGDVVMTYVVRRGYPDTQEGFPQFGVEAMVSHDSGRTWDLDHRYMLAVWAGNRKGPNCWWASSQATSSVLLPDGSILTAFGTGYRSRPGPDGLPTPRDVGLIRWQANQGRLRDDRTIADAPWDSDARNKFDLASYGIGSGAEPGLANARGQRNIALAQEGAQVRSSASNIDPSFLLYDPYYYPTMQPVTLATIPAWVEVSWPEERLIDSVTFYGGNSSDAGAAERLPVDYALQYLKGAEWVDLMPPVADAAPQQLSEDLLAGRSDLPYPYGYWHRFAPLSVQAIRLYITRSSDPGTRGGEAEPSVATGERETALRRIEVFAAGGR